MATENRCPSGIRLLQGVWEYIGESKVPHFTDRISFDGTRYREHISGGAPGAEERGVIEGDIACLENNRILVRVRKATPEGVFGNRSGDDYPCDVLTSVDRSAKDRILLICYVEWDLRTIKGLDLEYRRVPPARD